VEKAEIERAKRKPTESLDAYTVYLRGLAMLYQFTSRQVLIGVGSRRRSASQAIDLSSDGGVNLGGLFTGGIAGLNYRIGADR
jgi:hypothetical protein